MYENLIRAPQPGSFWRCTGHAFRLVDRDGVTVATGRLRDIHLWLVSR